MPNKKPRKDIVDLTGRKFGRLTVISLGTVGRKTTWLCRCDCGNIKEVPSASLVNGGTKSCGCIRKENMHTKTRLYHIWNCMKHRSSHKTTKSAGYFDRGIDLCKEWENFLPFKEWAIANGYNDTLSIDRIDNSKGYYPENCRWTTSLVQANNRRTCIYITIEERTQTFTEWCKEYHLNPIAVNGYRMYHKITHKEALLHYINKRNNET